MYKNKEHYKSFFPQSEEERRIDEQHGIKRNPILGVAIVTVGTILFWSFILFLIFGCEKQDPLCKKGEYTKGVVCPEIYEPVCAPDGTTYANSCYAEKDGWDNSCIILGECN
jgi:hypothetical protein